MLLLLLGGHHVTRVAGLREATGRSTRGPSAWPLVPPIATPGTPLLLWTAVPLALRRRHALYTELHKGQLQSPRFGKNQQIQIIAEEKGEGIHPLYLVYAYAYLMCAHFK